MSTDTPHAVLPAGLSATAFSSMFQAVDGLRNRRAIVALLGCMVAGVLVAALLLAMAGTLGMLATLLAMVVWIVAIGTGVNAAGLLQMDEARGDPPRGTVDALAYGLMCIPKLIVLGLAFLAVEVAVFVAIALVMLVCKIPFLGPLLFVVAFPLSVVVAGITIVGIAICVVLSLPAIWQGASIGRALTQTLAIVRSRLIEAVLLLLFVGFLCFIVGLVVFGVLGAGLLPTLGLSASILNFSGIGDMGSLMGLAQGFGGTGAGHMAAGAVGGLLLWAIAGSLVGQVYLRGLSLVYLRVTEGLDLGAAEAALRAGIDEARRRAAELGDKAKKAAARDVVPEDPNAAAEAVPMTAVAAVVAAAAPVTAPSLYNPPPAWSAPPTPSFDALQSASFGAPLPPPTTAPAPLHASHEAAADIDLPFDETTSPITQSTPSAVPAYASPPAWTPPPAVALPAAAPAAAATPASSACPQCLSQVTTDDLFCGVCGYRLK